MVPRSARPLVGIGVGLIVLLFASLVVVARPQASKSDERTPLLGRPYAFIGRSDRGEPYRWDPCSTIRYQVDLGAMPTEVLGDVREAVRRTSEASGLRFTFDGVVHGSPLDLVSEGDFVSSTSRGGLAWAPVLIAFRPQKVFHSLDADDALGLAVPVTSRFDRDQFVSGVVFINTEAGLHRGFAFAGSIGPVVQHELGHIVGLGHVLDPFELMAPFPILPNWGRGDLAGLRQLGDGPCLDVPTAELDAAVTT